MRSCQLPAPCVCFRLNAFSYPDSSHGWELYEEEGLAVKKVFASSALFLLCVGAVQAGPLLDFYIPTQASSSPLLSYAGGTAPVIASGLAVQSVTGNETSVNNGTALSITGGTMNFTSGNFVGTANGNWN